MRELHEGPSKRHFATEITQRKILDVGYWWPIMYRDVHDYYRSCDACQRMGGLVTQILTKLVTSLPMKSFMKRGFYFVGPIKLAKRYIGKKKNLVGIDYATKWVEAKALRINTIVVITKFMYECILTKFGCPLTIVIDQGVHFINDAI